MFLNRIFFLTFLYTYTCAAQSAIQIGSDDISYKIYRSAQSDSLDISARVEVFDPPITIDARDVENLRLPAKLGQPDLVLAKYLQTLSDGSGVKSALGLYKEGDPSIAYWQSVSGKRPNYALSKLEVSSKLQWRDYYVYELERFQKGIARGSRSLVFVRCQNQRCYLSSPDYLWAKKDKDLFFSLVDLMSRPHETYGERRVLRSDSFFYRFNPDSSAATDSELEFTVDFNWFKSPQKLSVGRSNNIDISKMEFPLPALVNALQDILGLASTSLDKKDGDYQAELAKVFRGNIKPKNAYMNSFQISTEVVGSDSSTAARCDRLSSNNYVRKILTWSEVIPVAYARYVSSSRPDLLSRIALFVKTKAGTDDYMLNVLYFSYTSGQPELAGGAGVISKMFCFDATYPAFNRYLMGSEP